MVRCRTNGWWPFKFFACLLLLKTILSNSALEVVLHNYALYKSTFTLLTYYFTLAHICGSHLSVIFDLIFYSSCSLVCVLSYCRVVRRSLACQLQSSSTLLVEEKFQNCITHKSNPDISIHGT